MALQSARMAGIEVPSPVFEKIEKFLDSVQRGDERVRRRQPLRLPPDATAPRSRSPPKACCAGSIWAGRATTRGSTRASNTCVANLPEWNKRNVYYWYYATQVLHHMEGKPWRTWNEEMRKLLPEHQVTRGRERGSWDPKRRPLGRRAAAGCTSPACRSACSKSITAICRCTDGVV